MRTLIVSDYVTLDGVMEAPGGEPTHPHTNWVSDYAGPEHLRYKEAEAADADMLLLGRVTYESFAGAWPTYSGSFADRMNTMPKVVVSRTLTAPDWNNTTVENGDVVETVNRLKTQDGGPILVIGSCTLVHTLLENDLVDELRLMVFPVTIGSGKRVFPESTKKTAWTLSNTRTVDRQIRIDTYHLA